MSNETEMKLSNPVRKVLAGKANQSEVEQLKAAISELSNLKSEVADLRALKAVNGEITTLKAAVVELENRLDEPAAIVLKKYMATGRVTFPNLGGLALPKNVGFHAYVDVEFEDVTDAEGTPYAPSREAITEKLQKLADKHHPGSTGVVLCDVSVLPAGW